MKPFNLEEYLKDPSKKVVTRDSRDVRIICTDRKGDCPIVALIKKYDGNSEVVAAYSKDGITNEFACALYDLFFASENKEGWVNIYKDNSGYMPGNIIHNSEKDAKMKISSDSYITTIKIEWEE